MCSSLEGFCLQDVYVWTVDEDVEIDTVIGIVKAGDKENDTVTFTITNSTNGEGMVL